MACRLSAVLALTGRAAARRRYSDTELSCEATPSWQLLPCLQPARLPARLPPLPYWHPIARQEDCQLQHPASCSPSPHCRIAHMPTASMPGKGGVGASRYQRYDDTPFTDRSAKVGLWVCGRGQRVVWCMGGGMCMRINGWLDGPAAAAGPSACSSCTTLRGGPAGMHRAGLVCPSRRNCMCRRSPLTPPAVEGGPRLLPGPRHPRGQAAGPLKPPASSVALLGSAAAASRSGCQQTAAPQGTSDNLRPPQYK